MSPNSSMNDTDEREIPLKASTDQQIVNLNRKNMVAVEEDTYET